MIQCIATDLKLVDFSTQSNDINVNEYWIYYVSFDINNSDNNKGYCYSIPKILISITTVYKDNNNPKSLLLVSIHNILQSNIIFVSDTLRLFNVAFVNCCILLSFTFRKKEKSCYQRKKR